MFIVSMKMTKAKLLVGFSAFMLVGIVCACILSAKGISVDAAKSNVGATIGLNAENNEQRLRYLKQFGWELKNEPSEIIEVAIPTEFNEVYEKYNILQRKQGFDLSAYRGKSVKRWTYDVTNYPNNRQNVKANLLVYEDKIIGGDICSTEADGFMHGFRLP